MINKAILVGNLGQEPELRSTAGGGSVATLSVATSERKKNAQTGAWEDHTEWHRVVCFGKTAEFVQNYLRKGGQVYVEGRLSTRKWNKDGVDRYTTEVVAEVVKGLSRADRNEGGGGGGGRRGAQQQEPEPSYSPDDEDIPF